MTQAQNTAYPPGASLQGPVWLSPGLARRTCQTLPNLNAVSTHNFGKKAGQRISSFVQTIVQCRNVALDAARRPVWDLGSRLRLTGTAMVARPERGGRR